MRSALIPNVTVRPNMLYIVRFRPYRPHGFVSGDASPLLSLTPQNAYNMLATSTTNKVSNQLLTRRCWILQSTPLKKSDDPVGTIGQPMRSALIANVQPGPTCQILFALAHEPHGFVLGDHAWPQNTSSRVAQWHKHQ